jgi:hypothetical protein
MGTKLIAIDISKSQSKARNDMLSEVMSQQLMNTNLKIERWWQRWRTNVIVVYLKRMEEKLIELAFQKK